MIPFRYPLRRLCYRFDTAFSAFDTRLVAGLQVHNVASVKSKESEIDIVGSIFIVFLSN
jgi:hypothetical protein